MPCWQGTWSQSCCSHCWSGRTGLVLGLELLDDAMCAGLAGVSSSDARVSVMVVG